MSAPSFKRRWRHRLKPWEASAGGVDTSPHRSGRRRRLVWRVAVPAVVLTALAVVPVVPVSGARASADSPPAQACPGGVSSCKTVSLPCPPGQVSNCPTVTVGPVDGIGAGQYVYIQVSGFTTVAEDQLAVAMCSVSSPDPPVVPDPQCADGSPPTLYASLAKTEIPVDAGGALTYSFATALDPSSQGNAAIESTDFEGNSPTRSGFYCDDGPNFCAITVTDSQQPIEDGQSYPAQTSSNTAIFPITFANAEAGCPSTDPSVFTDGSFSVQQFVPAAVDSTCVSPSGVADVNTATDTQTVVSDFADGGTPIAFTDEAGSAAELQTLKGKSYTYVPIAVSASVVAFLAGDSNADAAFPKTTFYLTPKMVAGLMTSAYGAPGGSDVLYGDLPAPYDTECAEIVECHLGHSKFEPTLVNLMNSFALLNPSPAGTNGPGDFGMFFSSVATGSSYQATGWLCANRNDAFPVTFHLFPQKKKGKEETVQVTVPSPDGAKAQDRVGEAKTKRTPPTTTLPTESPTIQDPIAANANTATDAGRDASQTLTSPPVSGVAWPPQGDINATAADWPFKSCSAYPALPILAGGSLQYNSTETPSNQAHTIRSYAYGLSGSKPVLQGGTSLAAFGAMDWSQAAFYGLDVANLLNGAGSFVAPSKASIDAALDDATVDSNGLVVPKYDDSSDAQAYPMPMVTYALVSTAPQHRTEADAEKTLLTNLVNFSHSGGSIPLPPGYEPLPDNLYNVALANIAKIDGSLKDTTPPTTPGTSGFVAPSGNGGGVPGSSAIIGTLGTGARFAAGSSLSSSTGPARSENGAGHRYIGPAFEPVLFAVVTGIERFMLPLLVLVALVGILLGPALLATARLRRSRIPRPPS
jgi:hypothetical protein